jgi:hypothetical protein
MQTFLTNLQELHFATFWQNVRSAWRWSSLMNVIFYAILWPAPSFLRAAWRIYSNLPVFLLGHEEKSVGFSGRRQPDAFIVLHH